MFGWQKSSLWWGPAAALLGVMEKMAAGFSQTLLQDAEQKDKRQGMQVTTKDFFQAGKRKFFQDEGCQTFEQVTRKSCGAFITLEMFKTQLDTTHYEVLPALSRVLEQLSSRPTINYPAIL